jgi:transcriptional regulator with XRE-family HTH domain
METYFKSVGARIALLRMTASLTQVELAEKSGITAHTVSTIENGKPANIKVYAAIAAALGVTPEFLMSGGDIKV